jgi:hypothetical protein
MTKHQFSVGFKDASGNVSAMCVRCSMIVRLEDGKIPEHIQAQERYD